MAISLFLSTILYQTSVAELEQGTRRPIPQFELRTGQGLPANFREALLAEREAQADKARLAIRNRLVILNILIMIGSGILAYLLAVRTLRPIEEAHAALERFTADASHELRTPITVMQTETEVTLMDPNLDLASAKQQLANNVTELNRLTELTQGLLRLARSGIEPRQMSVIGLDEIVHGALALTHSRAKLKAIEIKKTAVPDVSITGDPTALIDALAILLDNAIKYSTTGQTIQVRTHVTKTMAAISVIDHGQGIAAVDLPHIFERFYRADSSRSNTDHHTSYGLGLAIAHNVVTMHGGAITVASKPGKGSTFTITVPLIANQATVKSANQE